MNANANEIAGALAHSQPPSLVAASQLSKVLSNLAFLSVYLSAVSAFSHFWLNQRMTSPRRPLFSSHIVRRTLINKKKQKKPCGRNSSGTTFAKVFLRGFRVFCHCGCSVVRSISPGGVGQSFFFSPSLRAPPWNGGVKAMGSVNLQCESYQGGSLHENDVWYR
jgi:hypothetical protein